ncbi:TPA: hypothetical protein ACOFDS_003104 [Stenotrophomonas maltophilia]
MALEHCIGPVCFFHLDPASPKIFGFAELLAGLALIVVAWTIADYRFKFRIATAPIPVMRISSWTVIGVSALALLTDLWRAEGWLVPRGPILTPAMWQFLLAFAFLLTFFTWMWFAVIRPPVFGKKNAEHYANAVYRVIASGSAQELSVVADEMSYSMKAIVQHANNYTDENARALVLHRQSMEQRGKTDSGMFADDILSFIAYPRMTRAILLESPATAVELFLSIGKLKKFGVQAGIFGRNLLAEGLAHHDSPFFHEQDEYDSGLMANIKALSGSMFGSHDVVAGQKILFDVEHRHNWSHSQWQVYCGLVLMTYSDYVRKRIKDHSYVLHRAFGHIEDAIEDLSQSNSEAKMEEEAWRKLQTVVRFVSNGVVETDAAKLSRSEFSLVPTRFRDGFPMPFELWDRILLIAIIKTASKRAPRWDCWMRNSYIWDHSFASSRFKGPTGQAVLRRLRRSMFKKVKSLERSDNFAAAAVISFCLTVMHNNMRDEARSSTAIYRVVTGWMKRNYAALHARSPSVAAACLPAPYEYVEEHGCIVSGPLKNELQRHEVLLWLDP